MTNSLLIHIKSRKLYTWLSALMLLVWSCTKEEYRGPELDLNSSVKIAAFTANTVTGVVDDKAGIIQIELPFGTDLTAVKPTIEIPAGATVEPASGAAVNLRSAVKYRVRNGNIFSDYTVTATEKKAVLEFKAGGDC